MKPALRSGPLPPEKKARCSPRRQSRSVLENFAMIFVVSSRAVKEYVRSLENTLPRHPTKYCPGSGFATSVFVTPASRICPLVMPGHLAFAENLQRHSDGITIVRSTAGDKLPNWSRLRTAT